MAFIPGEILVPIIDSFDGWLHELSANLELIIIIIIICCGCQVILRGTIGVLQRCLFYLVLPHPPENHLL